MDPESRARRRVEFDKHPASYERARPPYPAQLLSDLRSLGGISAESRVLEIGCGPGTLTQSLAPIGCELIALELGPHMAQAARRNLANFPRVQVVHSAFETWELPPEGFDAVVAAGSFHWIDPVVGIPKILEALKPGGCVAVLNKHRVRSENAELEKDLQACYARWYPDASPDFQHPEASEVNPEIEELRREPRFVDHATSRCREDVRYDAARYRHLLNTYSDHTLLSAPVQEGLAECVCSLLDAKYGGILVLPLLCTMHVARKRSE